MALAILPFPAVIGFSGQSGSPAITPAVRAGADVSGSVESGSLERTYLLHLPPASMRLDPTPLVLALHGWPMTADQMRAVTHLSSVADTHGFAVLFPQGYSRSWSVPGGGPTPAHTARIDDVVFIGVLLDSVGKRYGLDTSRVVATGISNGGHMRVGLPVPTTS
jgi:polyhydroxybutyrate depolymerase